MQPTRLDEPVSTSDPIGTLAAALAALTLIGSQPDGKLSADQERRGAEACAFLLSFDGWATCDLSTCGLRTPAAFLAPYRLQGTYPEVHDALLAAVLAACAIGAHSFGLPSTDRAQVLEVLLGVAKALAPEPTSHSLPLKRPSVFTGLVIAVSCRLARLFLPLSRTGDAGRDMNEAVGGWLDWLTSAAIISDRPTFFALCCDEQLDVLSTEAARFIAELAAFYEALTPEEPSDRHLFRQTAPSHFDLASRLLNFKYYSGPDINTRIARYMPADELYGCGTGSLADGPGPRHGPTALLVAAARFYDFPRTVSGECDDEDYYEIHEAWYNFFACMHTCRRRLAESLDQRRIASLCGLLRRTIVDLMAILRDPRKQLPAADVPDCYTFLEYCTDMVHTFLCSGRISPIEFSKACGDAVSDLLYIMMSAPRLASDYIYEDDTEFVLELAYRLCHIVIPELVIMLSPCPVSRANLMRATIRSGVLDKIRGTADFAASLAALDTIPADQAHSAFLVSSRLSSHPHYSDVLSLSSDSDTKEMFATNICLLLSVLGTARDRHALGASMLVTDCMLPSISSCSGLESASSDPSQGFRDGPPGDILRTILHQSWSLRHWPPSGPDAIELVDSDPGPAMDALDTLASALSHGAGPGKEGHYRWALLGVADFVHGMHGAACTGVKEAEDQLLVKGKERGRDRSGLANLKGQLELLSGLRDRLRALGRRILSEYLPRVEAWAESEAARVGQLGAEEAVRLMRGGEA